MQQKGGEVKSYLEILGSLLDTGATFAPARVHFDLVPFHMALHLFT